jgi:hypothetical protein
MKTDRIDDSGWMQERIEFKKGRGRPRSRNALVFKTIGLTQDQWLWMELWRPGESPTAMIQELLERSMKFWPSGPAKFR